MKKVISLMAFVALSSSAMAQTTVPWTGAGDGSNYVDGVNWGGTAPADDLTTDVAQLTGGTVVLDTTRQVNGLDFSTASTLNGAGSIEIGSGGINVGGNSALSTTGVVLNQANTTIGLTGGRLSTGTGTTVSGTGALTVSGNNALYIDGGANTYAGGTTVNGGAVVSMKNGDALGTGILTLDNGTLQANGANYQFDETITVNAGGGTIDANGNTIQLNSTAVISGAGALTLKASSGGDQIKMNSNVNTYTGGTTIDNTKVWLKNGDALSTGDITLKNGGTIKNWNGNPTVTNSIIVDATGGAFESGWNNRRLTLSGVISGEGAVTINNDSSTVKILNGANTYSGGTVIQGLAEVSGSLGTGTITLDDVHGSRGQLKNNGGALTLDNDLNISENGGRMMAGWTSDLTITGDLSGSGDLTIMSDSGTVRLNGDNSAYTGLLTVSSGAKLGGGFTVANGAKIGGNGEIDGALTIDAGGLIVFSTNETLNVSGVVSLDSSFGIDDLIGLDSSVENGTYTLIDGDLSASFISGFENIGEGNALSLNDGKSAYFQEGSLQVTVIPEPAVLGLVAVFGGGMLFIRRLLKI